MDHFGASHSGVEGIYDVHFAGRLGKCSPLPTEKDSSFIAERYKESPLPSENEGLSPDIPEEEGLRGDTHVDEVTANDLPPGRNSVFSTKIHKCNNQLHKYIS